MLKLFYGLADAGDLRQTFLDKHLVDDIGMIQSVVDPSMYFHFKENMLIGINGTYVDDLLRWVIPEFEELCKLAYEGFKTTGTEELPLTFAGLNIRQGQTIHLVLISSSTIRSSKLWRTWPLVLFSVHADEVNLNGTLPP